MSTDRTIIVVEPDYRRRARIVHMLASEGRHAEPYEGLADLVRDKPAGGVWLVQNEDGLVAALAESVLSGEGGRAIIAYSVDPQLRQVVSAMASGASDYLAWPATGHELIAAIESAESAIRPRNAPSLRAAKARERVRRLTRREKEILLSVAMGATNRKIAQDLGISHRTVEIHRSNMLTKLEAANSPDAVRMAFDAGLID